MSDEIHWMDGTIIEKYSGRNMLVFERDSLERMIADFKDGDKVKIMVMRNNDRIPVQVRFEIVLCAAEKATGRRLTNTREAGNTVIRAFISNRLHREGYTFSEIGRTIHRDHSTVTHLDKRMKEILSVPGAYRTELEQFREFENILDQCE